MLPLAWPRSPASLLVRAPCCLLAHLRACSLARSTTGLSPHPGRSPTSVPTGLSVRPPTCSTGSLLTRPPTYPPACPSACLPTCLLNQAPPRSTTASSEALLRQEEPGARSLARSAGSVLCARGGAQLIAGSGTAAAAEQEKPGALCWQRVVCADRRRADRRRAAHRSGLARWPSQRRWSAVL